jgi:hypothetical protein
MVCKRDFDDPAYYRICVFGTVGALRSGWFDDLEVRQEAGQVTALQGEISDQAALYGLLIRIRDLGLPLLSLERVKDGR